MLSDRFMAKLETLHREHNPLSFLIRLLPEYFDAVFCTFLLHFVTFTGTLSNAPTAVDQKVSLWNMLRPLSMSDAHIKCTASEAFYTAAL